MATDSNDPNSRIPTYVPTVHVRPSAVLSGALSGTLSGALSGDTSGAVNGALSSVRFDENVIIHTVPFGDEGRTGGDLIKTAQVRDDAASTDTV